MSDWIVQPDRNDPELYEVAGVYLVASNLPIEDADLIAAAPAFRAALREIEAAHLGDQPAADGGTDRDWAMRHIARIRRIASDAIRKADNTYRGWEIRQGTWPEPAWMATSPNYDASYEGPEDGWVDNGEKAHAPTRDALIEEIDAWFAENASVDTHPEGGDGTAPALLSGAVGEAETPKPQSQDPSQ